MSSPDFMLVGMHVGKDNNMMQIETPIGISEGFYSTNKENKPSYYQVFRKNDGEITKVRFAVQQFEDTELDNKYILPLQNIINYIVGKDTVIDSLMEKFKKYITIKRHKLQVKWII